jgi:hypothetical protein
MIYLLTVNTISSIYSSTISNEPNEISRDRSVVMLNTFPICLTIHSFTLLRIECCGLDVCKIKSRPGEWLS